MANLPPATVGPDGPIPPARTSRTAQAVAIGLIAGTLAGLLLGFLLFKKAGQSTPVAGVTPTATTPTPSPSLTPTDTPSPTASPTATATPTATPHPTAPPSTPPPATATPVTSGQITNASFAGCPAMASGQHALAPITGPTAAGATANPSNEWYGCGNVVTPPGTPGFTGNNWELAFSFSCPNADAPGAPGVPGMNIESWVYAGGGAPIRNDANTVSAYLPWSDNTHATVPQQGDYRLHTSLVNNASGDNRCRWHIAAYVTPP